MDVCRICLCNSADKNICDLKISKKEVEPTYLQILSFCLDIQIIEASKTTSKLCVKCYRKIVSYYKFKAMALKNDAHLKALNLDCSVKLEVFVKETVDNCDISSYTYQEASDDDCITYLKDEPVIKIENDQTEYQSDDELLSVIKMIKNEEDNNNTDCKENAPDPVKKRGRPKQLKLNEKKCEICEECGKAVRDLKMHAMRHRSSLERKKIKCKDCDKIFSTYGSRYKHYKTKHLGVKKHCDICNKDVVHLRQHMLVTHNSDALPFGCVLCNRRFISPSLLEAHMLIHTKQRPFECEICNKKFRMKIILLHHIRSVHDKEKTHLCQFCSKSFFKKYHLQIHLRGHTKEKPYKCEECHKCFSSRSGLNNHKTIHSSERNFRCEFCDTTFSRRNYLRVHLLSHTKEKRHPCKYCGVRFGRSDHRKRHEYTAHEKHLLSA